MATPVRHCVACGAKLHGPFCSECGAAAGTVTSRTKPFPMHWLLLGVALAVLVGAVVWTMQGGGAEPAPAVVSTPAPAAGGPSAPAGAAGTASAEGVPPDLGSLTPRERFDRLFDRVMRASEGRDTATVTQFAPMALSAFGMLDAPDADARFHAGLIHLAAGDAPGAMEMASAIAAQQPRHLFGILLKGRIAEVTQDQEAHAAAHRAFREAYAAEAAAQRPEYPGHQAIIDRFLADASK